MLTFLLSFYRILFDWKAPFPYFLASILQLIQVIHVGSICILIYMMFFGTCVFLGTFIEDFENDLNELNESIEQAGMRKELELGNVRLKLKLLFRDLLQFHADIEQ